MRQPSARAAWFVGAFDLALALAFMLANFEPVRSAIGRASGLWHPCVAPYDGSTGHAVWSPVLILLAVIPVALGFVTAHLAQPGMAKLVAGWGATALSILVVVFVVLPTSSCIS
jgi:hypothetical protein